MRTVALSRIPALPLAGATESFSLARLVTAVNVARERRRLASLDTAQLADIGLTPAEAAQEASRPFWDMPRVR